MTADECTRRYTDCSRYYFNLDVIDMDVCSCNEATNLTVVRLFTWLWTTFKATHNFLCFKAPIPSLCANQQIPKGRRTKNSWIFADGWLFACCARALKQPDTLEVHVKIFLKVLGMGFALEIITSYSLRRPGCSQATIPTAIWRPPDMRYASRQPERVTWFPKGITAQLAGSIDMHGMPVVFSSYYGTCTASEDFWIRSSF